MYIFLLCIIYIACLHESRRLDPRQGSYLGLSLARKTFAGIFVQALQGLRYTVHEVCAVYMPGCSMFVCLMYTSEALIRPILLSIYCYFYTHICIFIIYTERIRSLYHYPPQINATPIHSPPLIYPYPPPLTPHPHQRAYI